MDAGIEEEVPMVIRLAAVAKLQKQMADETSLAAHYDLDIEGDLAAILPRLEDDVP